MDVEAQEKIPIGIHSPIPPAPAAIVEEEEDFKVATVSYADIAKQFSLLGWVAFGGPAAHIALFQKVRRVIVFIVSVIWFMLHSGTPLDRFQCEGCANILYASCSASWRGSDG